MSKTINIDDLEAQLQDQLAKVLATKKALNILYTMIGEEPPYDEAIEERKTKTTTKRDEYFNKPLATAVRMFLEKKGEAATVTEIIDELKSGGYDFGNERFADKNLRISLAKNTALFAYLKANDSFGLRKAYGLRIKEKLGKKIEKTPKKKNKGKTKEMKEVKQNSEEQPKKKRGRPPKVVVEQTEEEKAVEQPEKES